ncbi:MAG TPA: hypothetical protein VK803_08635 [Steroidobacteraceae bacterium]|jgi:hypothetical protein|nr:hypothetical protein [Steroidobacteraceae bacterium]
MTSTLIGRHFITPGRREDEQVAVRILEGRKEHHARGRLADAQLDPALLRLERLVGGHLETQLLDVKATVTAPGRRVLRPWVR